MKKINRRKKWSRQDSISRHAAINCDWVAKLESYHGATCALTRFCGKLNTEHLFAYNHTYLERILVEDKVM